MVTDHLENPVKAAGASSWRPRARWQIRSKLCFSKCPPKDESERAYPYCLPFLMGAWLMASKAGETLITIYWNRIY